VRRAIFCDYGELRPVRFKVAECTDYLDGHHTQPLGQERIALLVKVEPARGKVGFNNGLSRN